MAGLPAAEIDIDAMAERLTMPVLLVHDIHDGDVPVEESRRLAAALPNATLFETAGIGHNRVLCDDAVLDRIDRFIT